MSQHPVSLCEQAGKKGTTKSLSLQANFAWTLAAAVLDAGSKALVLIVVARHGTPHLLGQFAYGLAVATPIVLFLSLQLNAVQSTDHSGGDGINHYFGLRLISASVAFLLVSLVAVATVTASTVVVVVLVGLMRSVDAVGDVFAGLYQRVERMELAAAAQCARAALSSGSLIASVLIFGSITWGLTLAAIGSLAVLVFLDLPFARHIISKRSLRPRFNLQFLSRTIGLALPLGIVSLLDSLNANIPRYVLQHLSGEVAVGYFAAATYFTVVGATAVTAVSFAFRSRLALLYIHDRPGFYSMLYKVILGGAAVGVTGVALAAQWGRTILVGLYGAEYGGLDDILLTAMFAAALWYVSTCVAIGLTAARHFRPQPFILAGTLIVCGLTAVALVPRYGLHGAAVALVAAAGIRLTLTVLVFYRATATAPAP